MNNLQHIVKNDTRAAMHMAVELCEQGDFDSVPEAFRWLNQETVGNYTRWHELFGTPERAARTLIAVRGECESSGPCYPNCPFGDAPTCPSNCESRDYDALLEWLKQVVDA